MHRGLLCAAGVEVNEAVPGSVLFLWASRGPETWSKRKTRSCLNFLYCCFLSEHNFKHAASESTHTKKPVSLSLFITSESLLFP